MKEDKKREREREYKIEKVLRKTESARRKLWKRVDIVTKRLRRKDI